MVMEYTPKDTIIWFTVLPIYILFFSNNEEHLIELSLHSKWPIKLPGIYDLDDRLLQSRYQMNKEEKSHIFIQNRFPEYFPNCVTGYTNTISSLERSLSTTLIKCTLSV